MLALAAPVLAFILRGTRRPRDEGRGEGAGAAAPSIAWRRCWARSWTRSSTDSAARLAEFVAEAGEALARGIAEVLDRALRERTQHGADLRRQPEAASIDARCASCKAIDERIADIRQSIW